MAQPYLHGHLTCVAAPATWLSTSSGQLVDGADGLYVNDRRVLSRLVVTVDDAWAEPLSARTIGASAAAFFGVLRELGDPGPDPTVTLRRQRRVEPTGGTETLTLENRARTPITVTVAVEADADFAAMGAVKDGRAGRVAVAARLALPLGWATALGTVRALARRQGRRDDRHTEEAPGKILHEVRPPDAATDLPPVYYGSVDATALFVSTVADAYRWGAPASAIAPLLSNVEQAMAWLTGHEEFVTYRSSGHGLANQAWEASLDADGAAAVTAWLTAPELASPYGLRTLATSAAGYNPISYHAGSVWPHDTVIAVQGLVHEGQPAAAARHITALLAAAYRFDFRL